MKYLVFCIALLGGTFFSYAQYDSLTQTLTIKLPKTSLFHNIQGADRVTIPMTASAIPNNGIMSADWDTNNYNPYRHIDVQFPLQLKFTDSTYASPVSHKKVITSRYGWRRGRPHQGIDIDLVTGDSVVVVLDGIVRFAKYSSGHGKTVVVRHYNGLETTYAHLSHIAVQPNDSINKGQYLGKGGNTGNSRGSHLHFVASYKGLAIHPEYLFDFSPSNSIRAQELWITPEWTHPRLHNSKRISNVTPITSEDMALESLNTMKKVYVVRQGDTLYGIAKRNNLPIAAICQSNAIHKTDPLKIGQKLVLEL